MEKPLFIHILADFDAQAPETTVYKAILYSRFPGATIFFTHQPFKKGDVIAPAVYLRMVSADFPDGCFHLCALHIDEKSPEKYTLAKCSNQFFFVPDNGVLSLAFPGHPAEYFRLNSTSAVKDVLREIYLPALEMMVQNPGMTPAPEEKPRTAILPQPTLNGNTYRLTVLYNDTAGNAYLNMDRQEFERATNGKKFEIKLSMKETIHRISHAYTDVSEGTKLALFGLGDFLQIAVNCGSAAQYLGLKTGQMVMLVLQD